MNNDYSSKDFTSIYEDLLAIVEASTTLWNPRYSTEADPGVVILKAMALLEDKSNYRFDMSRAQAYLDTVSDRTVAYDLLAMLGYIMQGRRASEGFITVTNTSSQSRTIPQFSVVTNPTKEALFFTKEVVAVDPGESKSIPVQAGTIFQVVKQGLDKFTLKDIDEKGRLFLGKTNLAQNGIYVCSSIASIKWVYLDYVLLQDSDYYYTVGTSETGEMYIQFPDDYVSLIGADQLTVYATYTNGANSNIAKNVLSTFADNQKDASGQVQLLSVFTVSQTEDIYSGQDEETIEHAIQTYYETKDVCSTLVTAQDFTTALRYLLLANRRAFSNVLIETPQTKTKRMMTEQQGVSYVKLVKPADLDFNRVDVLPMKFSTEYYSSFKPYLAYSSSYEVEKARLETQIDQKLVDQKALPVKINIAGYDSTEGEVDADIQPIFAVFSPLIYVYLRDNSIGQQIIAREAIKRYFHTTYNMTNLTPGKPISETKVAEDIKKLSTNIISVTVAPIDYNMAQLSSDYLCNPTAQFSPESSLSYISDIDNEDLQLSILCDAVLAGDVPLFKYTNRQNSYSKIDSLYSQLTPSEQVLPIPWGVDYGEDIPIVKTKTVNTGWVVKVPQIFGQDYSSSAHTLTTEEMIQIRRPVFVKAQGWGQGMTWTYSLEKYTGQSPTANSHNNKNLTFYIDLQGDQGIYLEKATQFTPASEFSCEGNLENYFTADDKYVKPTYDSAKNTTTFQVTKKYQVADKFLLKGGYLPLSDFLCTDGNSLAYYLLRPGTTIESGSTYVMQAGESLIIQNASLETMATYEQGDPILLEGVTIDRAPGVSDILESAMNNIFLMAPKTSTISKEYVYFFCLNGSESTKTIKPGSPYTLEEGEYFIYADAGVTEYVTLGPGTELCVPTAINSVPITINSITFKAHNNRDIASILPADFEQLTHPVTVNFYEITTFGEGDRIELPASTKFYDIFHSSSGFYYPVWRTGPVTITVTSPGGTKKAYNISSSDYSIRHLAFIKTNQEGYAISGSTIFSIQHPNDGSNYIDLPMSDSTDSDWYQNRLYSSVALSIMGGTTFTGLPFDCTSAPIRFKKVGGVSIENRNLAATAAVVQGVKEVDGGESSIPSLYDLKISYTGNLAAGANLDVCSFYVPEGGVALFRFRYLRGTENSGVSVKLSIQPTAEGSTATILKPIGSTTAGGTHSLANLDQVFILPAHATGVNMTITLVNGSSTAYTVSPDNPYSFEAAIEDISIIDKAKLLDPQLDVTYSTTALPTQLGGSDTSSQAYKLLSKLVTASNDAETAGKTPFNWLYYSLDRLSTPLDPQSFFLPAHPKNSKVFPLYIEEASRIKFPQRG